VKKNIELKLFKALQSENVKLKTDSDKLNGILTNLVKNAIKYTKIGSIELGYSLNDSKTEIEFYIKDTGIGIPKNRQEAIFERFTQADIENKLAQQGAGLGLAIVRAYVEMLKGRIWVESEVNVGSTFYFTLPYRLSNLPEIVSAVSNEEKINQIKNLKILIVEDDEASNQLLSISVNKFSRKIIIATNGKEAIKACQNNPDIDLVLMDIQIPEMNGYEATKQIREFNKEVIIIAQTAFAFSGDREKAIAAGCNDYISKPIKKGELEIIIKKHFGNYNMNKNNQTP
jgi:CheY-like chemotaxis protein